MALRRSLARAALALGAFACAEGANQPAFADDTAAQLRELKALMLEQQKRIQQLWAAVAKSGHESREARKEIHEARKRIAPEEKAATVNTQRESNIINAGTPQGAQVPSKTPVVAQSAPPPVIASFANGLLVESPDHKWSFKVGGRILMDGGGITQPLNGFNNYATFREVRLEVEGKAAGIYFYELQYDFAGSQQTIVNNGNHVLAGMRDAYWGIQSPLFSVPGATDPGYVMVGSQWEPFSLEQINSSKYRDLIERAAPVDTFSPSRHLGLAVGAYGENWTAKGGLFTTSFEDANPFPARDISATIGIPRYYFPNAGNPGSYASAPNWFQATGGVQYFDGWIVRAPIG